MRGPYPIRAAAVVLALGLSNTAWALWSPEPTDDMDSEPLSAAVTDHPVVDGPKVPAGYTPPVDVQKMDLAVQERGDDPVIRHLAAGRAGEAIEIPLFGTDETAGGGAFTRVNPSKVLEERKSATSGRATDIPIPGPATYWLMLLVLPAFLVARSRFRGGS